MPGLDPGIHVMDAVLGETRGCPAGREAPCAAKRRSGLRPRARAWRI